MVTHELPLWVIIFNKNIFILTVQRYDVPKKDYYKLGAWSAEGGRENDADIEGIQG